MSPKDKPLRWLKVEIRSPPLGRVARVEAGFLLRCLQGGGSLALPNSRPMPSIGARVHELRIPDGDKDWRVIYRIDDDAIVIVEVFAKKTQKTPKRVMAAAKRRLREYDDG